MIEGMKWIVPAEGKQVRNPANMKLIPTEGMYLPWNRREGHYWRRRVKVGDCFAFDSHEPATVESWREAKKTEKKKGGDK